MAVVRDGDCRFFRVLLYCEVLRVFLVCGDITEYYTIIRIYKKRHPVGIGTRIHRDTEGSESHSREIQNYRNGGETRENIPFEIKKMIDSKGMDSEGMDSEGMEGKHRKIFGSNSKVLISKVLISKV